MRINEVLIILLQKLSGRIMSEPLRAIFPPEHIMFRQECQYKIKILNFCLGYFDKINLSKLGIIFFQIYHDMLKLV